MSTFKRHIHRLAATAAAGLTFAALAGPVSTQAAQTTNQDAGFLVVYDNNIEDMVPTCSTNPNDFNKLFAYIKAQPKSPDIFIVQQVYDQAQLTSLTKRMSAELPPDYAAVIALPKPGLIGDDDPDDPCDQYKRRQTNAVIYRTDRFSKGAAASSEIRWRSDAPNKDGDCVNLSSPAGQDRVENVAVRLTDKVAAKTVTVASFHWPTSRYDGADCADENIDEAIDRTSQLGGVLTILGGDSNAGVSRQDWWQDAYNANFRDAICGGPVSCPSSADTHETSRIDFILARNSKVTQTFKNSTTISREAAGGRYSDHLALRTDVKY